MVMAQHGARHGDMKAHEITYGKVMSFLKYGTIACALIAAFVVWLIA